MKKLRMPTKKQRHLIWTILIMVLIVASSIFPILDRFQDKEEVYTPPDNIEIGELTYIDTGEIVEPEGDPVFLYENVPEYRDDAYVVINKNVPVFPQGYLEASNDSFIELSSLDELGRCQACIASIGKDLLPAEERESIGMVKPTGWQTVRYDHLIEDKYLYNRCHLLGFQLTGLNADERNLITGTRYLNVTGMLPFENDIAKYVKETGNHVLYMVTPIFLGNELVARGVHMQARSIEDQGEGIMFNIYCYNVQPGIEIDYATGNNYEK